jgi:hypothetical protein
MTAMDENLVGYLLKALDSETQREVEAHVRAQPEAARKLELLRQALEPLAADSQSIEPPPGLRIRTLAGIAEYRCRDFPRPFEAPPIRSRTPARTWWRRADVLVAAALLLIVLPLIPPGLNRLRQQRGIVECQNNLHHIYKALWDYSDRHGGALPCVEDQPPRYVAGIVIPILREENLLSPEVSVGCPANGRYPPPPISIEELQREVEAGQMAQFMESARRLAGCYAYTLGYRDAQHRLHGLHIGPDQPSDHLPIMGDRPPFEQTNYRAFPAMMNSPNHNDAGQNVLFLSGRVIFSKSRTVGVNGNDIYLNLNKLPEAGVDRWDSVLGASDFCPSLSQIAGQ